MNTPEKKFWKLLNQNSRLPGDTSRIENYADTGTPDVTGAYEGNEYWIELKACSNKKKIADVLKLLEPSQKVWHTKRVKHGTLIFVMVKYETFIVIYQRNLRGYDLIHTYHKTKNKWPWKKFKEDFIEALREERM